MSAAHHQTVLTAQRKTYKYMRLLSVFVLLHTYITTALLILLTTILSIWNSLLSTFKQCESNHFLWCDLWSLLLPLYGYGCSSFASYCLKSSSFLGFWWDSFLQIQVCCFVKSFLLLFINLLIDHLLINVTSPKLL